MFIIIIIILQIKHINIYFSQLIIYINSLYIEVNDYIKVHCKAS